MYKNKSICIVVPAYNEEKLIGRVLETIPEFIDKIIVVDDASKDNTAKVVETYNPSIKDKLLLIKHKKNEGVGGAITTGYKWAVENKMDVTVVMNGDNQMHPADLPSLLEPVVIGEADYTKGNRLITREAWKSTPKCRYLGNAVLSLLTKIASGYWWVADSQSGYTAISLKALKLLNLDTIYKRFGMPNDMLIKLNVNNMRVRDVPISTIYNIGERSKMRVGKVIFTISWLLVRRFFWRLKEKYVIMDFHPLVFFYSMAIFLKIISLWLGVRLIIVWAKSGHIPKVNALALMTAVIISIQSMFFAMWMDMEYNKELK